MLYALASKELRLLLRDVHGLAVLFLMPTVFILIMSLALQDAFDRERAQPLRVSVTSEDAGALGQQVAARLRSRAGVELVPAGQAHQFQLYLPPGFSEQLFAAPDDPAQPLLRWSADPTVPAPARAAFAAALTGAVLQVQGETLISLMEREQDADLSRLREVMDPSRWHLQRPGSTGGGARLNAVQQSVPGWLVFAMFFVVIPLSAVMITEREQGTDLRLRAMQVPAWALLFARLPAYFLVNMLQLAAMLAVGVWILPLLGGQALDLGTHPAGLLAVASATSVAAIGLAMLVATLARTSVQAIALGGTLNLVFGALGGIMVPKIVMPAGMQAATAVSPMSWALEGFWDILLRAGSIRDAWPECAALCAFGMITLALAAGLHARSSFR